MKRIFALVAIIMLTLSGAGPAAADPGSPVIEVVTLKIKAGVSVEQFSEIDRKLQTEYISKREGFLSRESAPGDDNSWLVIVHWRSLPDAEASMNAFETASSAATFMSMIVPGSMVMKRYGR